MTERDPKVRAEIARLNKQFYSSFDTDYFLQKCLYLVALLSKPSAIQETLSKGVKFKSLQVKIEDEDIKLLSTEKLERNLKSEIATTYFHAIETLFRVVFAHAKNTDCPWIELTISNDYRKFKKNVEAFLKHEYFTIDHLEGVGLIFYGTTTPPDKVSKAVWKKSLTKLAEYLDYFGDGLIKSYAYNSYKHGLTMFSEGFGFELKPLMKVEKDDALLFLSFEKDDENQGYMKLSRNISFAKWEQKWALVYQLTHILDNVIQVGNWKYNEGDYSIKLFDKLDLTSIIVDKNRPFQPSSVNESSISFKMGSSKQRRKTQKKSGEHLDDK